MPNLIVADRPPISNMVITRMVWSMKIVEAKLNPFSANTLIQVSCWYFWIFGNVGDVLLDYLNPDITIDPFITLSLEAEALGRFLSGDRPRVFCKSLVDKELWLKLRVLRAERVAQRRSLRAQRRMLQASFWCPRAPSWHWLGNDCPLSRPTSPRERFSPLWNKLESFWIT